MKTIENSVAKCQHGSYAPCERCGEINYKDDCYPDDAGGWICENCADKYDRTPKDIEEDR